MTLNLKTNIPCHKFRHGVSIFLILFIFSGQVLAVSGGITIQKKNVPLKSVFEELETQTGLVVAYSGSIVDAKQIVSVDIENKELAEALSIILKEKNLSYTLEGNKVIITQSTPVTVQSDKRKYDGIILDEGGEPVIGANVTVKNTRSGTITDINGQFRIEASPGTVLQVSYIGYLPQEIKLGEKTSITINLYQNTEQLEEVVVVGYGVQRKRDVTTSISSVRASEIENLAVTNIEQALVGRMAGVQILQSNATPGAGMEIKVRGVGTITAGSSPLYVVDGVPLDDDAASATGFTVSPLSFLNMNDVESIEVLKDASAAAIYGSRGSNGVVIITTKTGKEGKPVIKYDGYAGVQNITSKLDVLDAYEYSELVFDAHNNTYFGQLKNLYGSDASAYYDPRATNEERWNMLQKSGNFSNNQTWMLPAEIMPYIDGEQGLTNTDWQDEIFRTGFIQKHNISLSGGNKNVKYFVSGNYQSEEGIVIQSDFKKMGFRTKLDVSHNKLKFGGNITLNRNVYSLVNTEGRYGNDGVVSAALGAAPIFPVYDENGNFNYEHNNWTYGQSKINNPVALATLIDDNMTSIQMLGKAYLSYEIIKGLTYQMQGSWNYNNYVRDIYRPAKLPDSNNRVPPSNPTATSRIKTKYTWNWENTLTYNKKIGSHRINGLAGWTAQRFQGNANRITVTDLPLNDVLSKIPKSSTATNYDSSLEEWSLLSAIGRVQYHYKDRYSLSAAVRADASSRFGANNKWGSFPSVSGAWYISEEEFMKPVEKVISNLKLRASWGMTGNMSIGNYETYGIVSSANYLFGGKTSLGMYESSFGSPDIGWEKTSQVNVGLELGFFNCLNIEMDIYKGTTKDMLLEVPVLQYSGFTSVLQNIGKLQNKGIELTLSTNHKIGNVRWANSFNYAANRNKVLALDGTNTEMITQSNSVIDFITKVGEPIGNYYTYVVDKVYQNEAEVLADEGTPYYIKGAEAGDFRFKKFNGGEEGIDSDDRTITGNYLPDFTYGYSTTLKYKSLDFSLALQGVYGNEIANINRRYLANMEGNANQLAIARDRWISESNPGSGNVYRANRSATGMNAAISYWHIEDGSYMRIREITVGYTLPKKLLSQYGISSFRVYFSTFNPFTFTKYSGYNPEVSTDSSPIMQGVDYGTYPLSKSFIVGLNFSL